ncbi:hypothetical protein D9M70_586060 [compost metagenome]
MVGLDRPGHAGLMAEMSHFHRADPDRAILERRPEARKRVLGIVTLADFRGPAERSKRAVEPGFRVPAIGVEERQRAADELHSERAACGKFDDGGRGRRLAEHHGEGIGVAIGAGAHIGNVLHRMEPLSD